MAQDEKSETFLRRWSRLKHEEKEKPEPVQEEKPPAPLPPVEKLTPESDFSPFMHPKVEDALRRVALKKLFSDPHFNLPDPYEAYSGDWTGGEPISQEMLATLNQAQQHLFSDKKKEPDAEPSAQAEPEPKPETKPASKPDEPGKQDA